MNDTDIPPTQPSLSLHVTADAGESDATVIARAAIRPAVRAGLSLSVLPQSVPGTDLNSLIEEITVQQTRVRNNDLGLIEEALVAQANTLDALFHTLTRKAVDCSDFQRFNACMQLALKAQNQSRCTLEGLSKIKNPPQIAYVRQANIGQAVQVNNAQARPAMLGTDDVCVSMRLTTTEIKEEINRLQNELLIDPSR
jgi:hypothetical protein